MVDIAELASSFWSQDHIVLLDTVARELISGQSIRNLALLAIACATLLAVVY